MNPGFASSQYAPALSFTQDSSPIPEQHRGSIDHALSSSNSTTSFDESIINVELMSRTGSDAGTLGSWQMVSPSSPADSSPELSRSMPYSPLHSNGQSFQDHGFTDAEMFPVPQTSHPSSQGSDIESRIHAWPEQSMDALEAFQFGYPQASMSSASTFRVLPGNESPWSHYTNPRMTPTTAHELIASTMAFTPHTYATSMIQQMPSSTPLHQPVNFDPVQIFENPHNIFPEYITPRHRSRSSSNSHVAILTPPPPPPSVGMDLPYTNSQVSQQLSRLRTDSKDMSQSLIAHAGSDKDVVSSPSSTSEYVIVEQPSSAESTSRNRRKRPRMDTMRIPSNKRGQGGSFLTLTLPANQRSGPQSQTGVSKNANNKARGGRKKNTHLAPQTAYGAREMRGLKACWICALQRDVCSPDEICTRCVKRQERGIIDANHSIGCIREKLFDYMEQFIPQQMTTTFDETELRAFATAAIGRFSNAPIRIEIQPILGLPNIPCELYEFEPRDRSLLTQQQSWLNPQTKQYDTLEYLTPPVSFRSIGTNNDEQQTYENYITVLSGNFNYMSHFARNVCFKDQSNPFLANLLTALVEFEQQSKIDFIRSVNKMLIASYIFTRGCLIPPKERYKFESLKFFQETQRFSFRNLPRMAKRQFKHTFLRILTKSLDTVLRRLDRVFRSSQGSKEWIMAFYGVLGLAMTFENMQVMVRVLLETDINESILSYQAAKSKLDFIIGKIDEKFFFINKLFRLKYNRSFNPITRLECRESLGAPGSQLVTRVFDLVHGNWDFAFQRQHAQLSFENSDMYFGRLVSQFLCSISPS